MLILNFRLWTLFYLGLKHKIINTLQILPLSLAYSPQTFICLHREIFNMVNNTIEMPK